MVAREWYAKGLLAWEINALPRLVMMDEENLHEMGLTATDSTHDQCVLSGKFVEVYHPKRSEGLYRGDLRPRFRQDGRKRMRR